MSSSDEKSPRNSLHPASGQLSSAEVDQLLYAAIVESADDGIISKTLEGIVTTWNRGAERIFEYTADEMIGKPIIILIPEGHPDEEPRILARLRRGEKISHYETQRITKSGKVIDVSLTVSPIRDSTGTVIGASKIVRDITESKRLEVRAREALHSAQMARNEAERANRLKDEFIATVSHELRTPLTAMMGWVRMLRSGSLPQDKFAKGLEVIERNVNSQAQLVEDLLDVSRITSGKLRLEFSPVDLSDVVKNALEAVRPAATAKNIRIQTLLDSSVGTIAGDFERLQQVIWNLMSNAIKFTPKEGRVQVKLERVNSHIELSVSDTGEGIDPEFLPFVFDRFRQADSSIRRKKGGLGLGLAIVKSLVELHGGTVGVTSEGEGLGSTFRVQLPQAPLRWQHTQEFIEPSVTADIDVPSIGRLRILLVDDEPDTCEMLETLLTRQGASVHVAFSAPQALQALDTKEFDILISDIGMPERDGYALIRDIRRRPASSGGKIPAIALTALARVEDRVKALGAGFQMHVPKPVEPTELLAIVSSLAGIISR